jgi:TonB family protein
VVVAAAQTGSQTPADSSEPIRVGPDVTPPRLIYKVEPEYSSEARTDHIQGTVVLQIVVNEKGRAADITVLNPLGYGLDEQAEAAVAKWEFVPGRKGGVPVKILAQVEVHFRFPGVWFDEKAEERRVNFNVAIETVNRARARQSAIDSAVKTILDLRRQKFPPAMFLAGYWQTQGEHLPKDTAEGLEWIQKAADKNYGPAIYQIAVRRIEGHELPLDIEKGLAEMRRASTLGSREAQLYLGNRYEKGDGVPLELDRARRYYRLCAAQGVAYCQYKLGRLLYNIAGRRERDYLEALALFQLAGEQGMAEAKQVSSREAPKLTAEQASWVATLKGQIVRK